MTARKLGELLVAEGRISEAVLTRALELQNTQARGLRLGAILLRWGLLSERALLESLSILHRCPPVDWATLSGARPEAFDLLTSAQSARLGAVPFAVDRKSVRVAFTNPSNIASIDEVQAITAKRVIAEVTTEIRLLQAQQRFYKRPLARDVWMIVQKIERPVPPPPPAPIASPAPLATDPPSFWIETEPRQAEASTARPKQAAGEPADDLVDPVPESGAIAAAVAPEPLEAAEPSAVAGVPKTDDFDMRSFLHDQPLAETLAEHLKLFSDDTTLVEFIEQALSFCETHPAFRSALASLDDGPIEELDAALEEERPQDPNLDSTLPSRRRGRTDYGTGLTA